MIAGYVSGVSLAQHTTFKTGGKAEYFAEATTVEELVQLLDAAKTAEERVTILGGGSNVLVSDEGIAGCVIKLAIKGITAQVEGDSVTVTAGAGEVFDELVQHCVEAGWWGLENLSAIPGSVGATPIQNVGAYGVEVSDVIHSVEVIHSVTGEQRTVTNKECQFGYRTSWFKSAEGKQWVVVSVTYKLSLTPTPNLSYRDIVAAYTKEEPDISAIRTIVMAVRAEKFPDWSVVGTAGSFFKNPIVPESLYRAVVAQYPELPSYPAGEGYVKLPLGWILDNICQVRGTYDGAVGSYEGQALVIVQTGGATTNDILTFTNRIAADVRARTGITIEREVTMLA